LTVGGLSSKGEGEDGEFVSKPARARRQGRGDARGFAVESIRRAAEGGGREVQNRRKGSASFVVGVAGAGARLFAWEN
jgi:hypothetical protein